MVSNPTIERFLRYVAIPSQSDDSNAGCPSTESQRSFAQLLCEELRQIGLTDITLDPNGYVMATLESNCSAPLPTIGFIAHLDTSPDHRGDQVKPRIVTQYGGGEIHLNEEYTLSPDRSPELLNYVGQDLIVTDGTTLLGADDKAGIAAIISAMDYLVKHPEIQHGRIRIAFTPDEEIGRGAHLFDVEAFGADWAYTIDGGEIGELEFENFNAAAATITVKGINVHPGYAKGKMRNSILMAQYFQSLLPIDQTPETTEKREGFFHLIKMSGTVEESKLNYIVRDHDRSLFEQRKEFLQECVKQCNTHLGGGFSIELKDQYYNMKEKIEPVMHIVDLAEEAMKLAEVTPKFKAIRGGTDGSQLSFKGLPCPNIFAGGHNFHGRFEYLPIPSLLKAQQVVVNICRLLPSIKR